MVLLVVEEIHPHHDAVKHGQNWHNQSSPNSTIARRAILAEQRNQREARFLADPLDCLVGQRI
jgi:hypothetical protein